MEEGNRCTDCDMALTNYEHREGSLCYCCTMKRKAKPFEDRLKKVVKIKNLTTAVDDLLINKGYKPTVMSKKGEECIVYTKEGQRPLSPYLQFLMRIVSVMGDAMQIYKIMGTYYNLSTHGVRANLTRLVKLGLIVKRYSNQERSLPVYELAERKMDYCVDCGTENLGI